MTEVRRLRLPKKKETTEADRTRVEADPPLPTVRAQQVCGRGAAPTFQARKKVHMQVVCGRVLCVDVILATCTMYSNHASKFSDPPNPPAPALKTVRPRVLPVPWRRPRHIRQSGRSMRWRRWRRSSTPCPLASWPLRGTDYAHGSASSDWDRGAAGRCGVGGVGKGATGAGDV